LPNGNTLVLYHVEGGDTPTISRDSVQTILFDTETPVIQTGTTFHENTTGTIPVKISIPDPDGSEFVQWIDIGGLPPGWTVSYPNTTIVFDGVFWKIIGPGIAHGGNIELQLTPPP